MRYLTNSRNIPGYDIIRYLDFHYSAYPDKVDFLRFLQYEISERLEREPENVRLVSAIKWVTEKKEIFQKKEDQDLRAEIEQDVRAILRDQPVATVQETNGRVAAITEKLEAHIGRIPGEAESGIRELTASFTTGNIELNNHTHEEKLIQY